MIYCWQKRKPDQKYHFAYCIPYMPSQYRTQKTPQPSTTYAILAKNHSTIKYLRWFSLHRQPQNIGYAYIMNHNLFSYVPFCETRKHHQKQPKSANILMVKRKLPITEFLSRKDGWSLVLEQNPLTIPVQPRQKTSASWKNLTSFITQKNAYPTLQ